MEFKIESQLVLALITLTATAILTWMVLDEAEHLLFNSRQAETRRKRFFDDVLAATKEAE